MKQLLISTLLLFSTGAWAQAILAPTYPYTTIPPNNSVYRIFDIANYGAKCDGTTDDTAAIQAASTAATVAGGTLLFTASNCKISNTITLGSNVTASGYGTTITPVTPRASWAGTTNNQTFVLAASATNVTIQGFNFAYDSTYNSGACHVIDIPSTASKVLIKDSQSTYCGDFSANIGATDVTVTNNRAYNVSNACYDNWNNATNVIITNNICTVLASGTRGIEFTGLTTALTAATSTNVVITGNLIALLSSAQQGINVDGLTSSCAGNAAEKYGTIADNHIVMAPGLAGNGILLRFCANYWDVHNNVIVSDGTNMAVAAIAANSDSNSVLIHNNIAYNWNNQTSGAERGLFRNGSVGGSLVFNECFSCTTATTLIGATDATTLQFANDTGTGALTGTFGQLTFSPGTSLSQATWGTAGIALIAGAGTFNDTTTGSGGVVTETAYSIGAPTFTNTQGTANVLTNAQTLRVAAPICGSGWASCTNLYSIVSVGRAAMSLGMDVTGGSMNVSGTVAINASNNAATNIGTGTTNTTVTLGGTTAGNKVNINSVGWQVAGVLYGSTTAPTINAHFNTSGDSITAASTAAFKITVGTGGATSTGSITLPTASNGWACNAHNVTNPAGNLVEQSASSTTGATFVNYVRTTGVAGNFTNSDVLAVTCGAF